jgi:hypothetical protein
VIRLDSRAANALRNALVVFAPIIFAPIVFALGSLQAHAGATLVDNFRLTDQHDVSHELYYSSDKKAVVLMAHGNGCEAGRRAAVELQALNGQYADQGVEVLLVDSHPHASREAIAQEARAAGIALPILVDETQLVGEQLGMTHDGEVLIVDPKGWKVAYRGALSAQGKNYAADVLDAVLAGRTLPTATSAASGCPIDLPSHAQQANKTQISYAKQIAPLLERKCVVCHREGGIGPWQMSRYEMIQGFAPMIREVVRTQRMPPWHADPNYGNFSNDRSLSNEQAELLVHWIEAGAPRGTGGDPLLTQKKNWPQWALGAPDLIVETPPFTVPSTGTIPYRMITVKSPLDRDVWVRAIDFLPGQRAVLHHIIASAGGERFGGIGLNNYVPGAQPLEIPAGNGIFLPKGSMFHFQMHYTPNGHELTDVTQMGLYFMKEPPQYRYRSMIFIQPRLRIPAGAKSHVEVAQQVFKEDAVIYSLHPHAHFRGKASSFVAKYPDGREQTLLNVPAYDFNWQSTYELAQPLPIPAGTKVIYTQVFDNSSQNRANPDPTRNVTFGEQTWDEMVFGVIRYRSTQPDADKPGGNLQGPSFEQFFGEGAPEASRQ